MKIIKFEMGDSKGKYDTVLKLNSLKSMNVRQNALEAARMSSNRLLEKTLGKSYFLKLKVYPFHILRENPLAAGAGADRMSTGMQKAFGKPIGSAARVREGQTLLELKVNKANLQTGKTALVRAAKKFPCPCKITTETF